MAAAGGYGTMLVFVYHGESAGGNRLVVTVWL
jgi:hypothetical protein